MRDRSIAGISTWKQHTTFTTDTYPFSGWIRTRIPTNERLQRHASGRAANRIGFFYLFECKMLMALKRNFNSSEIRKCSSTILQFWQCNTLLCRLVESNSINISRSEKVSCGSCSGENGNTVCTCSEISRVLRSEAHIWNFINLVLNIPWWWVGIMQTERIINHSNDFENIYCRSYCLSVMALCACLIFDSKDLKTK